MSGVNRDRDRLEDLVVEATFEDGLSDDPPLLVSVDEAELGLSGADRDRLEDFDLEAFTDAWITEKSSLLLNVDEADLALPGSVGSLDCTHVHWSRCESLNPRK
jgi:hypothetical protein